MEPPTAALPMNCALGDAQRRARDVGDAATQGAAGKWIGGRGGSASTADGAVVGERALDHGQRCAVNVDDAAADPLATGAKARAIAAGAADGFVADERRADQVHGRGLVVDAAAVICGLRPPAGDVADQRAVADGTGAVGIIHDRPADAKASLSAGGLVVKEGRVSEHHGHARAFAIDGASVAGDACSPTGRVSEEDRTGDDRGGGVRHVQPGVVLDGTPDAVITRSGAEGLIVVKGAGSHGQAGATEVVDRAADAAAEEGGAAAAGSLVAGKSGGGDGGSTLVEQTATKDVDHVGGGGCGVVVQGTVEEGQAGPGLVEDAAPSEAAIGLIVGHRTVGENQTAGVIDAATCQGLPVGDGQAANGHARQAADVEDPAGGMAADGQLAGAGAFDVEVLGDFQCTAL